MNCPKCSRDVSGSKNTVKCFECGSTWHATCSRIRTAAKFASMSAQALAAWKCDSCAQDSASMTSVKSDSEDSKIFEILQAIQRDIAVSQAANSQGFTDVNEKLNIMQLTLNDLRERITAVELENAALKEECGALRKENITLYKNVSHLEIEIEEVQQYSRNRNIEVKGIPLSKNENVYYVLECVAKAMGIIFNRNDISIAHRLPAPRDKRFSPSIVVQFVSRSTRAEWMATARQRKIQTTDLSTSLRPAPILLVDHLTPQNKRLLGHARTLVKNGRLAYAWTKEGKVLVRESADGPVKRIRTLEEIEDVVRTGGGGSDGRGGGGAAEAATVAGVETAAEAARKK